jgi:4-hydroxy-tetrahydrodipicolinate reductase
MTLRVAVFGAGGRMGATVCAAVDADPDLELVAAIDPHHAGFDLREVTRDQSFGAIQVSPSAESLDPKAVDVAVDFTVRAAAKKNLDWLAANGVHAVVGTTGLTEKDCDRLRKQFTKSNCIVAPNFAIGAVLMMRFAEMAAPYFESAEIIELHHGEKVDAPSGTAMLTAERLTKASDDWIDDPTRTEVVKGARGGRAGPIPVHSVRLRGLVAHQEVLLGTMGQTLSIRHDSYDRSSFMPGVLLAVKKVADTPGLTVGLDQVLGL